MNEPSTLALRKFFHDTRGGLAVISSYLDLLQGRETVKQDPKAIHFAQRCSTQIQELLQLLDEFEKQRPDGHG